MMRRSLAPALIAATILLSGCEKAKAPQPVTTADVESAKQEAQRQVAEARAEASKDVRSAAKVSGSDVAVVSQAKITGAYDVAMTKAEGDRKVATAKCMTLQVELQQACTDRAEADYQTAATAAKANRLARER